ncbi:hypothetical protein J2W96_007850 [Variovorax guangxiensis]|nr:hypothetical protein [Variovorax guangxiensis]
MRTQGIQWLAMFGLAVLPLCSFGDQGVNRTRS